MDENKYKRTKKRKWMKINTRGQRKGLVETNTKGQRKGLDENERKRKRWNETKKR